jgi:aryl-alcohol dehydrogenase-like predicted oxidoreductase
VVDTLNEVATRLGATPAQVAIAWLIARPSVTAPIASATSVEQFGDPAVAARLNLDPASVARLNEVSDGPA